VPFGITTRCSETTEDFLKSKFISVDVFAASPVEENKGTQMIRRVGEVATEFGNRGG